jgi:hypothetical protein
LLQQAEQRNYHSISTILRSLDAELTDQPQQASRFTGRSDARLHMARRIFMLIPLVVFLLTLALFAGQAEQSLAGFAQALLRVIATSLASSIVCIAAYGFYSYLQDKSYGL